MNKAERQINQQLCKISEKQDRLPYNFLNSKGSKMFIEDTDLSEWRTSSYPVISNKIKLHPQKSSKEESNQEPASPEQLSHRYTFLNMHINNTRMQSSQPSLLSPKKIQLSLSMPNPRKKLPLIHSSSLQKQHSPKIYSPKNCTFQFIRYLDLMKNKHRDEKPPDCHLNWKEPIPNSPMKNGKFKGNIRKIRYHIQGKRVAKNMADQLQQCMVFLNKD